MPEPWRGTRYDFRRREEEEEELTLTPHHTPSQSFDFIVWDKAYLDSIPAAGASTEAPSLHSSFAPPPSTTKTVCVHGPSLHATAATMCVHGSPPTMCVHGPSLDAPSVCVHIGPYDNYKQRLVPLLQSPSSCRAESVSTLMACRTDADLPPSFIDYKPRVSDASLTSLEEAVRHYACKHPEAIDAPSPNSYRNTQRICTRCAPNDMARLNVNHEVSLQRSYSQPGGGSSKGMFGVGLTKHTSKHNFAADSNSVFGRTRIHQDQFYAGAVPPARHRAKLSCCPTSPGRRKHRQVTLDDCELTLASEMSENHTLDLHQLLQQEKLRSPACNLVSDKQQNSKLLSPTAWADATDVCGHRHWLAGTQAAAGAALTAAYNQDSFSDMSSDYDHHHDAAAALNMSKFKLWGLHHRFKALCRKLCSICTF